MKKGDIWIIETPTLGGHEQEGIRPAIIVADIKSSVVIVIPCTSNLKALQLPYTFSIDPSRENGLKTVSIGLILQIRAVDKKRLRKHIGSLEKSSVEKMNKILKKLLAI